jgi:hypothetical protein
VSNLKKYNRRLMKKYNRRNRRRREEALAATLIALLTAVDRTLHLFERHVVAQERIATAQESSAETNAAYRRDRKAVDERDERRWQERLRREDRDRTEAHEQHLGRLSHEREQLDRRIAADREQQEQFHAWEVERDSRQTRAAVQEMFDERERRDGRPWHPPTVEDVVLKHSSAVPGYRPSDEHPLGDRIAEHVENGPGAPTDQSHPAPNGVIGRVAFEEPPLSVPEGTYPDNPADSA